jgi:hypothetical protein
MKTCNKCGETKNESEFYQHKNCTGGRLHACKTCHNRDIKEYIQRTPKGMARKLLGAMKNNSKKRGLKWDDSWWTTSLILERIEGKACEVTGVPFEYGEVPKKNQRRPFVPSPDRKDNAIGYRPDNVQFVVWIYNLMKNSFSDEDVARFLLTLKDTKKT